MSRLKKLRPSPALAVAVAAMVVAVAGVAIAGPVAHNSGGALSKKKVKNIARAIAADEVSNNALPKTAIRTAVVAGAGTLVSGNGITAANVTHPSTGNYCIGGLSPGFKDIQATLDFSETPFKAQLFVALGAQGPCAGKQAWVSTYNSSDVGVNARFHVAVFN